MVAETNRGLPHPGIRPARRSNRPALHHYDRLGLLTPSGRSDRGYRLYRDCDLARLEQIVVLKFLGLPLKQIGRLPEREAPLSDTLTRQQRVLAEKRRQIDVAIPSPMPPGSRQPGSVLSSIDAVLRSRAQL